MKKISWPQNKPFALCLTHDVDRFRKQWYHYGWPLLSGRSSVRLQAASLCAKLSGREPYDNFREIMDLEDAQGVRSTFLFLNETKRGWGPNFWGRYRISEPQVVRVIQSLDTGGWEIGLHGSYDSYNNFELLSREKTILEDIVGHSIVSTRQHHLRRNEATWRIQSQVGLLYDSTQGYADRIEPTLFPYQTDTGIWELPLTVMDTLALDGGQAIEAIWTAFDRAAESGGLMTLNFHQCRLNLDENPYLCDLYAKILLKAKDIGAHIAPMTDIGQHLEQTFAQDGRIAKKIEDKS